MGKKRKYEVDLDAEKTLYSGFVAAANSVSQLYVQAVQQQRKTSTAASRQTLERIICYLLRDVTGSDHVSKAALLHFLQQEYEGLEGSENMPHHFPVQFLPTMHSSGPAPAGSDEQLSDTASKLGRPGAFSVQGHGVSPGQGRRAHSLNHGSGPVAMDAYTDRHGSPGVAVADGDALFTGLTGQQQQQGGQQRGFHFSAGSGGGFAGPPS